METKLQQLTDLFYEEMKMKQEKESRPQISVYSMQ